MEKIGNNDKKIETKKALLKADLNLSGTKKCFLRTKTV